MRFVNQKVEFVDEENILKKIELAGRCCYNSQNLITDDSYHNFVRKIVKSGHTSVIEHSNIIIKYYNTADSDDIEYVYEWLLARKGATNAHVLVTVEEENAGEFFIMISGNARGWIDFLNQDNQDKHLLDVDDHIRNIYMALHNRYPEIFSAEAVEPWTFIDVEFMTEAEAAQVNIAHTSYTFKITTSRDITHQLVRHRTLSFSQQSQRYVNFSLDKNGGEITFINPRFVESSVNKNSEDFTDFCANAESTYLGLIDEGIKPEVARCVLPNCTQTIIYITGHYDDWQHFIELRADSHAQLEIQEIAKAIDKKIEKCYID